MQLITHQTGPRGPDGAASLHRRGLGDIARELYLGVVDRALSRVCFMASSEGGMDIEEVAAHHPEKILKEWVDPRHRPRRLPGPQPRVRPRPAGRKREQAVAFMKALYALFIGTTARSPRSTRWWSPDGDVIALDARSTSTTTPCSATPSSAAYRDLDEEDPREIEASKFDLNYIASTATSAAWSTAPASPWPPWTSSSTTAASPRTSSTSAAAPHGEGHRGLQDHPAATRT
jgi:succinyl-CoA synthetase beta subunit